MHGPEPEQPTMATRILLFTGKGGVGKTTCAAATALRAAEMGYRTLVLSSDPAHSLADALDRKLGPEPELVVPNLWAQEVDLYYSMKKYWGNMRELMLTVFRWQGVDRIAAEEMAALPGMNEGSVLLWLEQFHRSGDYDLIVVDSAPTGETLTLLTLPQATEWWLDRAFPFQKTAIRTAGFALRKTTGIPLDRGYDELQRLFQKLRDIQAVLGNADVSSVRLVANPERMVIEEAKRAYTYLQLYGYAVDAVVVNRVLPREGVGEALAPYLAAQAGHLEEIHRAFEPLPIFEVPHSGREVFGLDLLREIGERIYGDRDPTAVLFEGQTYRVTESGRDYLLEVRLPFAESGQVTATRAGEELVIQIGGQRRSYPLPKFLAYYTLGEVRVERGWLRVRFGKSPS
jgi:arsenite/tail-anchored protein-transporting ATPase